MTPRDHASAAIGWAIVSAGCASERAFIRTGRRKFADLADVLYRAGSQVHARLATRMGKSFVVGDRVTVADGTPGTAADRAGVLTVVQTGSDRLHLESESCRYSAVVYACSIASE